MKETSRPSSAEALLRYNSSTSSSTSSQPPPAYEVNDLSAQTNVAAPEKAHTPQETAADSAPAPQADPTFDVERDTDAAIAARVAKNMLRVSRHAPGILFILALAIAASPVLAIWALRLSIVIKSHGFCTAAPSEGYYYVPGIVLGLVGILGLVLNRPPLIKMSSFAAGWLCVVLLAGTGLVWPRLVMCGWF